MTVESGRKKEGMANHIMNESEENEQSNKDQADESIGQITSLSDFYEDFRPEDINEFFLIGSSQNDRSIHHENIWFFTRF
jgi:hypothetical protein